jgi:predicted DNA-binding protein
MKIPRIPISVAVSLEAYEELQVLSDISGMPLAAIARDILEATTNETRKEKEPSCLTSSNLH